MRKIIIVLLIFGISMIALSQNDSILILRSDYIIFNQDTLNRVDSTGLKLGQWIEFHRTKIILVPINNTDSIKLLGEAQLWVEDTLIMPEHYLITFKGNYTNDKKQGIWEAYHKNGKLWKNAKFESGFPNGNFYFYYNTGRIMMLGLILYDGNYQVYKFNEDGCLVEDVYYNKSEIEAFLK